MGVIPPPEISETKIYQITNHLMSKFKFANQDLYHGMAALYPLMAHKRNFQNSVNTCHKHLNFTFEISNESVNFIDNTIYKCPRFQNNKVLVFQSYVKPTKIFQYLHNESAHSSSVFKGCLKVKCSRQARNQVIYLSSEISDTYPKEVTLIRK